MPFWGSGLLGSILDGVVFGAIIAVLWVYFRGPVAFFQSAPNLSLEEDARRKKRDKRQRRIERAIVANRKKARPVDYLQAWGMFAVIAGSASYAVAGGHGEYGILTAAAAAVRTVADPARLALMIVLNVITLAAMGAVLWTIIWGIGMLPLRFLNANWAKAARLYHGTLFGIALGALIGVATTLNQAIAGNIVGPLDLLFAIR